MSVVAFGCELIEVLSSLFKSRGLSRRFFPVEDVCLLLLGARRALSSFKRTDLMWESQFLCPPFATVTVTCYLNNDRLLLFFFFSWPHTRGYSTNIVSNPPNNLVTHFTEEIKAQ